MIWIYCLLFTCSLSNINELVYDKLNRVNTYYNKFEYRDDFSVWGVEDYWATPYEFDLKGKGDCEDFAISKYFALINLNIDPLKLQFIYAIVRGSKTAHLILTYMDVQGDRHVLDNLINKILPLDDRLGLIPIFAFNNNSIWIIDNNKFTYIQDSNNLDKWVNLQERMTSK